MSIAFLASSEIADEWVPLMKEAFPGEKIVSWPNIAEPAEVEIAFVARPPAGALATLPNLKLAVSMWVGVDSMMADPSHPRHVPLTAMVDPGMTQLMTESVLLHVLTLHRQLPEYRALQDRREWKQLKQPLAAERKVGILGLGSLGADAGLKLASLGFDVAGWSRSPKNLPGIQSFAGDAALTPFLSRTEILISLLPLTPDTFELINAAFLARLPKGAGFINVARGAQVKDEDLLAALDIGHIGHAILDVFHVEPLPTDHRYWTHPRVSVMPHIAAHSPPESCVESAKETVRLFRAGLPLPNQVDFDAGY
jgi:glyoxylate/hydroxypyruvate reductase A